MEYILIFISAIFVNNIVLSQFLGICPFLGVSKKVETALGMSAAVAFVLTIATIVTFLIQKFVLDAFGLEYLLDREGSVMLSGLTNYLPETALTVFDNLEFFIRIVLAAILGALVGLERSKRQKEAGVRTHCIIACTSALFMILSKYAFVDLVGVNGLRGADPARIAAQVVSGISFLGAGVIFKNGNSIRGLTTAAGMWGTAAVGMAIGAGMYWVGLIEAAVLVGIQIVLHRFPVGADALTTQEIVVEMTDSDELLARFDALVKSHRGQITESSLTRQNGILCMEVTAKLDPPITHEEALAFMKANDGVRRVSV